MKRASLMVAVLLSGCGGPEIPRLPPISIGGGGVRLMNEAKTPAEAYENAYGVFTGCHNRVRSGLGQSTGKNYLDAAGALEEVAESLRVMRALVVESARPPFDPYIELYDELASDVGRQRPPANWRTRIDQAEKDIKSKFSYASAPIVSEWPPELAPGHEKNSTNSKPASPGPEAAAPPPPSAPKAPSMPLRLAFKAWKQSHADLASAFQNGRSSDSAYGDVRAAIDAMKESLPKPRHAKLDLMIAVYEQQHAETKGFTSVPAHGSRELILKQLDVVKETLETEYDPDRK